MSNPQSPSFFSKKKYRTYPYPSHLNKTWCHIFLHRSTVAPPVAANNEGHRVEESSATIEVRHDILGQRHAALLRQALQASVEERRHQAGADAWCNGDDKKVNDMGWE